MRLQGYDYSQAGAYFVTICTEHREYLFGDVVGIDMVLNEVGSRVQDTWLALSLRFPAVELDAFVVMPNHVHGVILLLPDVVDTSEKRRTPNLPRPGLPRVVGAFKSLSAIEANGILGRSGRSLWQRSYYDHVIRSEMVLDRVRQYITDNPAKWELDPENPSVAIPGPGGACPAPTGFGQPSATNPR